MCLACDRASGAWDARHVVNGNAVYQLPFGHGKPMLNQRGIASAIAGGWELTTTALARTGFPVNVLMPSSYIAPDGNSGTQRPDLVPGVSLTPPGAGASQRGSIPRPLLPRRESSAPRRATWFAGRAPGRSISAPARRFHCGNAGGLNSARSSTTSSITRSSVSRSPPSTRQTSTGFGSIINTVNLNTAIVSPITPVGSGTPREMQFALRFEF